MPLLKERRFPFLVESGLQGVFPRLFQGVFSSHVEQWKSWVSRRGFYKNIIEVLIEVISKAMKSITNLHKKHFSSGSRRASERASPKYWGPIQGIQKSEIEVYWNSYFQLRFGRLRRSLNWTWLWNLRNPRGS